MAKIALRRCDIPFDEDAARRLAARLDAALLEDLPEVAACFDLAPLCEISDFMQRRTAMLEALDAEPTPQTVLFCDADAAGHFTALGDGLTDFDALISKLSQKGFCGTAVIARVRGTDALERSVSYLKQKLFAYEIG